MATHKVEQGPTGSRVAENVAALRKDRGLTLGELSGFMKRLGRPILPSGLSKIEQGWRRVDADDLVALAVALDVTPNRLLLPATASPDDAMDLTEEVCGNEEQFWAWATGAQRLPLNATEPDPPRPHLNLDLTHRFRRENRPHEPSPIAFKEVEAYEDRAGPFLTAVDKAVQDGVPWDVVFAWVSLRRTAQRFAEVARRQQESTDEPGG